MCRAYLVGATPVVQEASERELPLPEAVSAIETALAREGALPAIANAGRAWRREDPTGRQVAYLRRLDPSLASVALEERWDRGRVSLAITGAKLRPILRRLVEGVA